MNVVGYYRRKLGMKQKELGEVLSCSLSMISHYETGRRRPGLERHRLLIKVLGISEAVLENGEKIEGCFVGIGSSGKRKHMDFKGYVYFNMDVYNLPDYKRVPLNTDRV